MATDLMILKLNHKKLKTLQSYSAKSEFFVMLNVKKKFGFC